MRPDRLRDLLEHVARGELDVDAAYARLRDLPFADLGHANVDHHRMLRQGFPEAVYAEHKTAEQIADIAVEIASSGVPLVVTRLDPAKLEPLRSRLPAGRYDSLARCFWLRPEDAPAPAARGYVAVVCAGTSDLPVAEEAALTLEAAGHPVRRVRDVGVAGIHRLLARREVIAGASVVVAVAGMEGTLPTAVAGLVRAPVVAVPTSVGYGVSTGGLAALLSMLASCAPNVAVVNVDNGFGAGVYAATINGA
ncbi:MAG TPA: nickel pincer cofactor biosynthesis protein LarB [Fredinandcohnia sp.]|nr:nickel pincer cofactor biosynthesis protein LarB [Fredinandcohnia sp.]